MEVAICNLVLRQICFPDFAYSHYPCLSQFLYEYVCAFFCVNVCCLVAKILNKFTCMDSNISIHMAQVKFFY